MLKRVMSHIPQHKMLLLAVIISLILHSLILAQFSISLPELNVARQMLEMRLVKLPAPQAPAPRPVKKKAPPPEPAAPVEKPAPVITPLKPEPSPISAPTHEIQPMAEIPASTEPLPEAASQQAAQELAPIATVPLFTEPEDEVKEYTPQAYQYVETKFEVRRGNDASAAGEAIIVFNAQEDSATYTLSSTTEAKGLASLFFDRLIQTSEGSITEKGLRPNHYRYQYGSNEKKTQYANFAWSDGIIEMHSSKGIKTEQAIEGTQDLLSFMYQFMYTPPLASMQITMTNGKNLRTYTYSFEGEKVITTKLGDLKTIHILKTGTEDEKTELWLAIDYQYLPVKVRKTEKNGNVIEQTATHISTERQEQAVR